MKNMSWAHLVRRSAGVIVLGAAVVAAGCDRTEETVEPIGGNVPPAGTIGDAGIAGPEAAVDIEDVVDNPANYAGQTVTLSGEVEESYAPGRAFSMTGSGVIAENQILVLTRQSQPVEEGHTVRATGQVRAYAVADLEQFESDLGWDFSTDLEAELERVRTVLVADSVTRVGG